MVVGTMMMISLSNSSLFLSPSLLPITNSISHSIRELRLNGGSLRRRRSICCFYKQNGGTEDNNKSPQDKKESQLDWPILKRWDVPWEWQTVSLTSLACGLSFVLTGLTEAAAIPYLGIKYTELSLDEKAELLFVDQAFTTAVVLAILYSLTNTFQPRDDLYRYDLRDPFDLKKGWLLWAGIGLTGAVIVIALTGVVMSFFNGETPERKTDALAMLLPLIGSSSVSTACLIGVTGVLAPVLEENVFRGFLMVSLTKWLPTPVSVLISAAVFAVAHLTPGQFPQLFVLGTVKIPEASRNKPKTVVTKKGKQGLETRTGLVHKEESTGNVQGSLGKINMPWRNFLKTANSTKSTRKLIGYFFCTKDEHITSKSYLLNEYTQEVN